MIAKLLAFTLALSFDTFLVSVALGMILLSQSRRRNLILLFAMCDGFGSLAGFFLSANFVGTATLWFGKFQPFVLCLYLLLIIGFSWYLRTMGSSLRSTTVFYLLPLLLSFDNLTAGVSLNLASMPPAVFAMIAGFASALAAWFGLQLGSATRRHLPIRTLQFSGFGLLFLVAALQLL